MGLLYGDLPQLLVNVRNVLLLLAILAQHSCKKGS